MVLYEIPCDVVQHLLDVVLISDVHVHVWELQRGVRCLLCVAIGHGREDHGFADAEGITI